MTVIEITLTSGVIAPEDLQRLGEQFTQTLDNLSDVREIILSGRMPVWAFAHLAVRAAGEGRAVATFDPRLQAGVIVWPAEQAGRLLPLTGEEERREIVI